MPSEFAVSLSVGTQELAPQVNKIIEICEQRDVSPIVILAGHLTLDPLGSGNAIQTAQQYPYGVVVPVLAEEGTFSMAYLKGWKTGAELAQNVISLDADGSHDPMQILEFIDALRTGSKAVLGSRNMPGSKNNYPLQRRIISGLGTMVASTILNPTGPRLTDFTSEFEGINSQTIKEMFHQTPANSWISATHGPYHLQNTELRMRLLQTGIQIDELPIEYGTNRIGKKLKMDYLFKALYGFTLLIKNNI